MRAILVVFMPFFLFFTIDKPGRALLCLLLQVTLIGWLPASVWAFVSLLNYNQEKRNKILLRTLARQQVQLSPDDGIR